VSPTDFSSLELKNFYHGAGDKIVQDFVLPVLGRSVRYDRLTGYFNVAGLVGISTGLEELFKNSGRMRLVIGLHDVPGELLASLAVGQILPEEVINKYQEQLLGEIGFLKSEAEKSCLVAVAWLIRLNYLQVVVATPRNASGIFHQKRMIFESASGEIIAGTGSLNETLGGHGNSEEMYFQFSWQTVEAAWQPFVDDFERIWAGESPDVVVRPLDIEFAIELLSKLDNPPNPFENRRSALPQVSGRGFEGILSFLRESTSLAALNSSKAVLYPHQERVFIEALSNYPVRKILGDEVGLGKTLEAGSVISHLIRTGQVRNVLILAPAGLMNQWQQELSTHFSLQFWKWQSGNGSYVDSNGNFRTNESTPELRIISAQWARINPERLANEDIDLLVVDEAHAARLHRDAYGTRKTKLWKLLKRLSERVPNILLLTATPMQTDPIEFHGLLEILGLNEFWEDFGNYEKSLKVLSSANNRVPLQEANELYSMLLASIDGEEVKVNNPESRGFLKLVKSLADASKYDQASLIQKHFPAARNLLVEVHPGHRLIVRNTKSGLAKFGYRFPERKFISPPVSFNGALSKYEGMIESYLAESYGAVEEALAGESGTSLSFAKSTYYQRLVSSLSASEMSLKKRLGRIEEIQRLAKLGDTSIFENKNVADEDFDEIDLEDEVDFDPPMEAEINGRLAAVVFAAQREIASIRDLLTRLENLVGGVAANDPKFSVCLELIREHWRNDQILIFSKYTDTIEAFVSYFKDSGVSANLDGFAYYTGNAVWIEISGHRREASKSDVTSALSSGEIQIVFCSDAASEGLNLQTARVVINLDVPWNPARLEQRIGRIARLGQKALEVDIYNLWYPQSIEARMYRRLLERRQDYQIAVGEFPEIFGKAITSELGIALGNNTIERLDPISLLTEIRSSVQRAALDALWSDAGLPVAASTEFRAELKNALLEEPISIESIKAMTSEPGLMKSLSLQSPELEELSEVAMPTLDSCSTTLEVLIVNSFQVALCIKEEGELLGLVSSAEIPDVIRALSEGTAFSSQNFITCTQDELRARLPLAIGIWCPAIPMLIPVGADFDSESVSYALIGRISVQNLMEAK